MIQVQVEVESGAGRFLVSARAASIERALSLIGAGRPGITARVVFPREPGTFSASDAAHEEGVVRSEPTGSAA